MPEMYQRLLVPVNGSEGDFRALAVAGSVVHKHPVAVTLIYVVEVQQSMPLDAELPNEILRGEEILNRAEDFSRTQLGHHLENVGTELLQARTAGSAIVDEAIERRADAILMAATNHQRLGKTTMGDTVAYVLKNAPCEVIVVRGSLDASVDRPDR